jgi:biotin carboxyl carrier protein
MMPASIFLALIFSVPLFAQGGPGERRQKEQAKVSIEDVMATYIGQVEAGESVVQLAPFSGRVVRHLVSPGSMVKPGQPVVVLSQKTLGEVYSNFTTKANISGVLNEYHFAPGEEFSPNTPLFTILDNSEHRIKITVSNRDHGKISLRDKVEIVTEDRRVATTGTVSRRSLAPIGGTGLFAVEIRLSKEIPIGTFCQIKFQEPSVMASKEQKLYDDALPPGSVPKPMVKSER